MRKEEEEEEEERDREKRADLDELCADDSE
jgi:hypothetical protein